MPELFGVEVNGTSDTLNSFSKTIVVFLGRPRPPLLSVLVVSKIVYLISLTLNSSVVNSDRIVKTTHIDYEKQKIIITVTFVDVLTFVFELVSGSF